MVKSAVEGSEDALARLRGAGAGSYRSAIKHEAGDGGNKGDVGGEVGGRVGRG